MRKLLYLGLVVTLAAAMVAGCGPAPAATPLPTPPPPAPKPSVAGDGPVGGTLVTGALMGMEPKSLNPDFRRDDGSLRIAALVYCPLVWTDTVNKTGVFPALAKKWEVSPDGAIYTFYLYDNAKWHDGKDVTSADVVWTFNEVVNKKGGALAYLQGVKTIDAPDKYTVKITLEKPNAAFLSGLGVALTAFIMPKHLYEGTDWANNPYNDKPVGCGPFKFVEWVKGSYLSFEANTDFYLGRPHVDKLVMRFYALETLITAFEAGEVQYAYDLFPFSEITRLKANPKYRLDMYYPSLVLWMGFNTTKAPFNDVRVRKAIAHAVDREEISKRAFSGLCAPNWGTMPQGWAYSKDAEFKFDPKLATQLLDEVGLKPGADGIRLKARYTFSAVMGNPDIAPVLKEQLKKVGIDLTLESMDFAAFTAKVTEQRDFEIAVGGGYAGPDPADFEPFVMTGGYRNIMGYSNKRVDDLFVQARLTPDQEARKKAYQEIQKVILDEVPRINFVEYAYHQPILSTVKNPFWDKALQGKPFNPYQGFLYTYLQK